MSTDSKAFSSVTNYERVKEQLTLRRHRVLDERDNAIFDALKIIEARSDSYYPAVQSLSREIGWLALIQHQDLVITGTNLIDSATKSTGTQADSTGQVTFTAVVPGEQTITVTIEDTNAALAITADAAAGTIEIVHGSDGGGAGGASTAAEIVAAINADAVAKFMVQATVGTAGDIDADETVTVDGGTGSLPVLQIDTVAVDGSVSKTGITIYTDTAITFDFDATALASGKVYMLRLWVDDVLAYETALVADSEPWGAIGGSFFCKSYDFELDAAGTLPAPLAKDLQTANIAGDFVADVAGGVWALTHDGTSEAQAGQLTFGDQLVFDPTKNPIFEARLKINFDGATFSADQRAVVGLCSAHTNAEDGLDAVVSNLWFRVEGANLNILIESDDGTLDDDDNDSTLDIVDNTYTVFRIDASDLNAVKFYVNGVLITQTLDAGALTNSNMLQPIFCIQRDAGAEAEVMSIDWYRVRAAR